MLISKLTHKKKIVCEENANKTLTKVINQKPKTGVIKIIKLQKMFYILFSKQNFLIV